MKYLIIILVIGAVFIQSCSQDEIFDQNEKNSSNLELRSSKEFDGQDYFIGIFFGVNSYGQTLNFHNSVNSQFATLSGAEQKQILAKTNDLVSEIQEDNPYFFSNFYREIESKDPIRIQTAIGTGSKMLYEHLELLYPGIESEIKKMNDEIASVAMDKEGNIDKEKAQTVISKYESILSNNILSNNEDNVQALGFAIVWAVYAAAAVHNTIALTANVAVVGAAAIYLAVTFWGPGLSPVGPADDSLPIELLIAEIAE